MNLTKEKIFGYVGSLIFCAILLLILWFSVLKTVIETREEGVLVNFGNIDEASGTFEPSNRGDDHNNAPTVPPPPVIPAQTPQTAITQNIEQTVSVEEENKRKEEEKRKQEQLQREQEEQKRQAELERQRREEEQRRQQAINSQVAGAFGAGNNQSAGQGAGAGQGNQGNPLGNSDQGVNTNIDSWGGFSLEGRKLGPEGLPRPPYSVQEEGIIVIDITVDSEGKVIAANIGKGTNIGNATMRRDALNAARKAKFNAIQESKNQQGSITYRYNLK